MKESIIAQDTSPEALAICQVGKIKPGWITVNVSLAASVGKVTQSRIVWKLKQWDNNEIINLSTSQFMNRYRLLKDPPDSKEEIWDLAAACWEMLREREKNEIIRFNSAVSFATTPKCLAAQLAAHFHDTIPDGECAKCSYCLTQRAATFTPSPKHSVDVAYLERLVSQFGSHRDARLIVRLAFGIKSPKIMYLRLDRHEDFGQRKGCDFDGMLEETERIMREQDLLD